MCNISSGAQKCSPKSIENAARPAGTLKIMLASFLFMRSQGISLLNFPNCMDFSELFMIHSTGQERSTIANLKLEICTQMTCHKGASPPWTPLPRVVATGPDFWYGLIQNWLPAPFFIVTLGAFPQSPCSPTQTGCDLLDSKYAYNLLKTEFLSKNALMKWYHSKNHLETDVEHWWNGTGDLCRW